MKRKILSVLLCAAMVASMIAGCGAKEEAAVEEPAATEESAEAEVPEGGKLTLMLQADDDVRVSIMDDYIVPNFEEAFPGWELEVITITGDDNGVAAMKTYNATGDLADVYWSNTRWCMPMISSGNQLDLTEYITSDGFADNYGGDISLMQFNGAVYALQPGSDAQYFPAMYYNKEIFEANDIEVPTTLDELYAVCDKLLAAGITPIATDGTGWDLQCSFLNNFILAIDPSKVDALLNNEIDYSDEVVLEAFQIYETMMEKGYFGDRMATSAKQLNDAKEAFIAGEAAMRFDMYWNWSSFDNGTTDVFPFPTVDGVGQLWGNTTAGYAVYSKSENLEMAVKLAEYCCEQEAIYHNEHGTATAFDTGIKVEASSELQQKLNDMCAAFTKRYATIHTNSMDSAVAAEFKTLGAGFIAGQYDAEEFLKQFNEVYAENTFFE